MLVIISDLHLTDGTASTIDANAFNIFRERLQDLAKAASLQQVNGTVVYKPIERFDLLLLGDILDVIRSTRWLQNGNGGQASVHPWDDPTDKRFVNKVKEITDAILNHNQKALAVFQGLKRGVEIDAAEAATGEKSRVPVSIYYLIGNHDWFYHLTGSDFDNTRNSIVQALGLANDPKQVFPHSSNEVDAIRTVCEHHHVFACHGDIFDSINYEGPNRNRSSLGDAVVIELVDRFAHEVKRQLQNDAPEGLEEIDNVRPLAMIPTWLDGLLRKNPPVRGESANSTVAHRVRSIWNQVVDEFLADPFVKQHHSSIKWGLKLSEGFSFRALGKLVPKAADLVSGLGAIVPSLASRFRLTEDYSAYALYDEAFQDANVSYIVYGHTHHHELVPLQAGPAVGKNREVMYLNSGTWRPVFEQARSNKEFFPYYVMAYLAFFRGGERKGKAFETWSGSLEHP